MKVTLVEPYGYCAGVTNAIKIALEARKNYPSKQIFILGMLVHNDEVVRQLAENNITTIFRDKHSDEELIRSLPEKSVLIFSAHGHDYKLDDIAKEKNLIILDTTCPKVKKNIDIIKQEINKSNQVIYIGHKNHPEALAALAISKQVIFYDIKMGMNYSSIHVERPLVINQTTLNTIEITNIYEEITQHFPNACIEDEICNTTRLRQEGIKNLPNDVDLIIIVGDNNSSNTRRLFEIASQVHQNTLALLISSKEELDYSVLKNKNHIAIASGASTPIQTINDIVELIKSYN